MPRVTLVVPTLVTREVVRVVTAQLRDLPGVLTLNVDSGATTITVDGDVTESEVRRLLAQAGHPVLDDQNEA